MSSHVVYSEEFNKTTVKAGLFLLVVIQFGGSFYHALTLPLQYDEWFSWRFFSGKNLALILGEYPAPNNHIFYNLIAWFFLRLEIDAELAVRLPAVLAGVLAVFFFHRLCQRFFSPLLSLLLSSLLVANYQFASFAASARGYGFIFLFSILLLYAIVRLHESYRDVWARIILILSAFMGMWTMPSFIYVLAVPSLALFVSMLWQREWRSLALFTVDGLVAAALVAAGYSGILFFGDPQVLLHPEAWTEKYIFDENGLKNLAGYWQRFFGELFPAVSLVFASALAILSLFAILRRGSSADRFIGVISAAMFFFPPFIVILHRVYPFTRSLSFVVVPALLLGGFLLREIGIRFWRTPRIRIVQTAAVFLATLMIAFVGLRSVAGRYEREHGWEYRLEALREGPLKNRMGELRSVARTSQGIEFYAAEILLFMAATHHADAHYELRALGVPAGEDVLVIHRDVFPLLMPHLTEYRLLLAYSDVYVFASEEFLSPD